MKKITYAAGLVLGAALLFSSDPTAKAAADTQMNSVVDTGSVATMPDGISICGEDVSGKSITEAQAVVQKYMLNYTDAQFTLTGDGDSIVATGSDLGIGALNYDIVTRAAGYGRDGNLIERFIAKKTLASGTGKDYSITLSADQSKIAAYLSEHIEDVGTQPVNCGLKRENGRFVITDGKSGYEIDVDESAARLYDFILNSWDGGDTEQTLAMTEVEPEGDRATLSEVKDVLGSFHTDFSSSSAARATNVKNGASKLDGTVLYPGETVSVAEKLNPMTAENGYEQAPSYENGTTVLTYGGGICQVSTTLYNAVMRSELEIVTRSAHSMVVNYVEPSMDAAIAGTAKDFQFKNNKDYPIYIEGYTSNGNIYFNIYGKETRPANRTVEFESEILSQTDPANIYEAHGELPIGYIAKTSGSAHTGYTAQLWKIVYEDGVEKSRDVYNHSAYRVTNNVYAVGVGTDNPDAYNAMMAAIATGDGPTINSTAAAWGDPGQPQASLPAAPAPETAPVEETMPSAAEVAASDGVSEQTAE